MSLFKNPFYIIIDTTFKKKKEFQNTFCLIHFDCKSEFSVLVFL